MKQFAICGTLILMACASIGGTKSRPLTDGTVQYFQSDVRAAVLASRNALVAAQLEVKEVDELDNGAWMIVATRAQGGWTQGEIIRVVVQSTENEGKVGVWILTRRRSAMNLTAKGDWSKELFSQIALDLDQAR